MPSAVRTWLQLFRAPNLLTVPGDPLAGYLLASLTGYDLPRENLWPVIGASLCFYGGGLLLNDLVDKAEDLRERPNRPLPSGAASTASVAIVAALLFVAAMAVCLVINPVTFAIGGVLLFSIVFYNCVGKRVPLLGALNMGICRGLSLFLGATAVIHSDIIFQSIAIRHLDHLLLAILIVTGYIATVTQIARFETRPRLPAGTAWLPMVVLIAGATAFLRQLSVGVPLASLARSAWGAWHEGAKIGEVISDVIEVLSQNPRTVTFCLLAAAIVCAFKVAWRLTHVPGTPVPREIGVLIRLILLVQAAFCAAVGGVAGSLAAAILVILWPVSHHLGRKFYAS